MFCSNCGQQIPQDSRFCEHCGVRVEQKEAPVSPEPLRASPPHAPVGAPKEPACSKVPACPSDKKKIIIITAIIFVVIAIGVCFLKLWMDNGKPSPYSPNQKPNYSESGGIENADDEYITSFLSTYDRPSMEDFGWYEDVFKNGVWSGAKPVTELAYMLGGWKCYIVYDPYRNMDSYAQELANVDIAAVKSGFGLKVDWYQMYMEGEAPYDESAMEDSVFTGSYENGEFYLTGPGNITLGSFYEYEGAYYGFGSLLTSDGITADFCLMRKPK